MDHSSDSSGDDSFEYLVIDHGALPYNQEMIENLILTVADRFNLRIIRNHAARAIAVSAGITIIGSLIGRHVGGNVGAMLASTAAGAYGGIGVAVLSIREAWPKVKNEFYELYAVVYDHVSNMGFDNYAQIIRFFAEHSSHESQLAQTIIAIMKKSLGQQNVLSSPRS